MAPSLFSAVTTTSSLANGVMLFLKRRGYAAATAVRSRGGAQTSEKKAVKDPNSGSAKSSASSSWIPDPVTGYYRPANGHTEVDAAELRNTLLSRSTRK